LNFGRRGALGHDLADEEETADERDQHEHAEDDKPNRRTHVAPLFVVAARAFLLSLLRPLVFEIFIIVIVVIDRFRRGLLRF